MNTIRVAVTGVMLLFTVGIVAGCSANRADEPAGSVALRGAGSTFIEPLFRKWREQYPKRHPGVAIVYAAVGSGKGTKRFMAGTVDFGASDAAMSDAEMASVKRGAVLIPVTAGSIVLAYSPEGMPPQLKLSRLVYTDIFLGKIARWDDDRIAAINPGVALPKREIQVVVRQDGSGTTFAFSKHLSAISEVAARAWRRQEPGLARPGFAHLRQRRRCGDDLPWRRHDRLCSIRNGEAGRSGHGLAGKQGGQLHPAERRQRAGSPASEQIARQSSRVPARSRGQGFLPDCHLLVASALRKVRRRDETRLAEGVRPLVSRRGAARQRIAWLSPSGAPCRFRRDPCGGVDFRKVARRRPPLPHKRCPH